MCVADWILYWRLGRKNVKLIKKLDFFLSQVPIIIHRNDLQRIAPLWLAKTIEIRKDRKNWPKYV
jgi:hypothetical protein